MLAPQDVIGKTIVRVLQTSPQRFEDDGWIVDVCRVFVMLNDGKLIELDESGLCDDKKVLLESNVDCRILEPADIFLDDPIDSELPSQFAIGQRITNVVVSEYWPSFALLLSNGFSLHLGSDGIRPHWVGACLDRVDCSSIDDEYKPFWQDRPINVFDDIREDQ